MQCEKPKPVKRYIIKIPVRKVVCIGPGGDFGFITHTILGSLFYRDCIENFEYTALQQHAVLIRKYYVIRILFQSVLECDLFCVEQRESAA